MVETKAHGERAADAPSRRAPDRPDLDLPAEAEVSSTVSDVLAAGRPGRSGAGDGAGQGSPAGDGAGSPGAAGSGIRRRDVVALGRMAGNAAVSGFLGRGTAPVIQREAAAPGSGAGAYVTPRNPNIEKAILAWRAATAAATDGRPSEAQAPDAAAPDAAAPDAAAPDAAAPDAAAPGGTAASPEAAGPVSPGTTAAAAAGGHAAEALGSAAAGGSIGAAGMAGVGAAAGAAAAKAAESAGTAGGTSAAGAGAAVRRAGAGVASAAADAALGTGMARAAAVGIRAAHGAGSAASHSDPAANAGAAIGSHAAEVLGTGTASASTAAAGIAGVGAAAGAAAARAAHGAGSAGSHSSPASTAGAAIGGHAAEVLGSGAAGASTTAAGMAGVGAAAGAAAARAAHETAPATPAPTAPGATIAADGAVVLAADTVTAQRPPAGSHRIPPAATPSVTPVKPGFKEPSRTKAKPGAPIRSGASKAGHAAGGGGAGSAGAAGAKAGGGAAGGGGGAAPAAPAPLNDPTLAAWRASTQAGISGVKPGDMGEAKDAAARVDTKGGEIEGARSSGKPDFEADAKSKQPAMPQEPEKAQVLDTAPAERAVQGILDAGATKLNAQTFAAIDFSTMPKVPELAAADFVPKNLRHAIADMEHDLAAGKLTPEEKARLTRQLEAAKAKVESIEAHAFDAPANQPPTVKDSGPAKLEPIDPAQANLLGDAIGRLLGQAPAHAGEIVKKSVTAMHGDKVPKALGDAEKAKPAYQTELETELRGIADAAGVTSEALNAKVEEQKAAVKKEEEAVQAGIAASTATAKDKVEKDAAADGKKIAGAAAAVTSEIQKKQEAVEGPPDTEAIERKRDEFLGKAEKAGGQALAALRASDEKRQADLAKAAGEQKGQVTSAVNTKTAAIRRHWETDTATAEEKARPTTTWGGEAQKGVDSSLAALKDEATKEVANLKEGVQTALDAGKESIREWAASQQGRERSWWERLLDLIHDWGRQATANNEAWEQQRNAESRDAMAKDFETLTQLKETEATKGAGARDAELARLSGDQQALAKAYFGGQISGVDFVARSTMARITARRVPELSAKLEADAIKDWGHEDLNQLAVAVKPGFNSVALAEKIRGAVAGPGTNEAQVFEALGGAVTPVERAALAKAYTAKFGVSMEEDVRGDLSGHEAERADALMAGKGEEAEAAAIKEAVAGLGTDEDAVRKALRGKTPEQLAKIKAEYKRLYGVDLAEDLDDDMDGAELDNALALADGDVDKADAAELEDAMAGPGTDEEKLKKVYERIRQEEEAKARSEGVSPAELQRRIVERNGRVKAKYNAKYGDLDTTMTAEMADVFEMDLPSMKAHNSPLLKSGDVAMVEALQSGDITKIDAAKALSEHDSTYTSDDEIEKAVRDQRTKAELDVALELAAEKKRIDAMVASGDLTKEEAADRRAKLKERQEGKEKEIRAKAEKNIGGLKDAYKAASGGQTFDQLIAEETTGYSESELDKLMVNGGKLSDEDELYYATAGVGTDEDRIKETLKGKTPAEIAKISEAYFKKYGRALEVDLAEDLSGRELLDVNNSMQYGDPETFQKQLADAKSPAERASILAGMKQMLKSREDFEKSGWIGSYMADGHDPMNSAAQLAEAIKKGETYNAALDAWEKDNPGKKPNEQSETPELAAARANFEMDFGGALEAQEQVRAQIDSYTDAATQVGGAVVALVVTVATMGSAGPAVAAVYGALASAAATMAMKVKLKGAAYDWEEMGVDMAVGAVDAIVSGLTAGLGEGLMDALEKAVLVQAGKAVAKEGGEAAGKAALRVWIKEAMGEAIENAIQGIPSAAVGAMLDDNTWKSGDPWGQVVKASGQAAGMGAAMGVGMKGAKDLGGAALGAGRTALGGAKPKAGAEPHVKADAAEPHAKAGAEPAVGPDAATPGAKPDVAPPDLPELDLPPEANPALAAEKAAKGELPPGVEGTDLTKGGKLPESTVPEGVTPDGHPKAEADTTAPKADADAEARAKAADADAETKAKPADAEAKGGTDTDADGRSAPGRDGKAVVEPGAHGARPDEPRPITDAPQGARQPGGPSKADVGKTLTPDDLSGRYGMPLENVKRIEQVCSDLGVIVDVRPTTPYAEPMLRNGTALPKPEKLKAKTISEIDVMIGLATEKDLGKVGFFDPATKTPKEPANFHELDPDLQKEIKKRIDQRTEEFAAYGDDMKHLVDEGLIEIKPDGTIINKGLIPGGELPFTGDHDIFDIRAKDGTALTPQQYQAAKKALIDAKAGVMHGAVTGWEFDSPGTFNTPAGQKSYGKMVGDHTPGGKEPLIRFGAGEPTATWYEPARPRPDVDAPAAAKPGAGPHANTPHADTPHAGGASAEPSKAPADAATHPDEPAAKPVRPDTAEPAAHADGDVIEMPEGSVGQLPGPQAADRAANQAFFDSWHSSDPTREIALMRNSVTGEYVVVQGTATGVALGRDNPRWQELLAPEQRAKGRWTFEAHAHPVDVPGGTTPRELRLPSGGGKGGDMAGVGAEALRTGAPVSEQLRYVDEQGPQTLTYGCDPKAEKPFFIERVGADGTVDRRTFGNLEEYEAFFRGEVPGGDPGAAHPAGPGDDGRSAPKGEKARTAAARRTLEEAGLDPTAHPDLKLPDLERLAGLAKESERLFTPDGIRQQRGNLAREADAVRRARAAERDLNGSPLQKGTEHADVALARMEAEIKRLEPSANDDALTAVRKLEEMQRAIARAGETLRASASDFGVVDADVGEFTSKGTQFAGAREARVQVEALGTVTEPLERNLPGGSKERGLKTPAEIRELKTVPPELAGQVAAATAGFQRAHLIGPGFGGELAEGLMLAPEAVNQQLQNRGVETFIRGAADWTKDLEVRVKAEGRRIELPLEGGGVHHVDLLDKVTYEILAPKGVTYTVEIQVGPPATVKSTIPGSAPGARELAKAMNVGTGKS